jgi:hypothetical protein
MTVMVVSFATLLTAHVALTAGLLTEPPRIRALVAFVLFPLAPYWGFRGKLHGRSITWLAALSVYVATRVVERITGR